LARANATGHKSPYIKEKKKQNVYKAILVARRKGTGKGRRGESSKIKRTCPPTEKKRGTTKGRSSKKRQLNSPLEAMLSRERTRRLGKGGTPPKQSRKAPPWKRTQKLICKFHGGGKKEELSDLTTSRRACSAPFTRAYRPAESRSAAERRRGTAI